MVLIIDRYRPENFLNGIKARTMYQIGPILTNPEQYQIWSVRRMALVATSLDGPASSWFNSLSETDTHYWSNFSTKFRKQLDCATIKFKAQAEAQDNHLTTHESISIYACRVENLVIKGWPEMDSKMKNREYVNICIQSLPFKLKCTANGKKLDHNPTVDEPVIPFETLKKFVDKKHLANDMTSKFSMRLTIWNLKNVFPSNHVLKHAFKQNQIMKNQRSLVNSAVILEKMVTLSHDALNDKLINIVNSILKIDNNMIVNLKLLHRKCLVILSKLIKIYQRDVPLLLMFFHRNHIIVLPHNHFFEIKILPQDTDPLHMMKETDRISLLTIVLDLSPQTVVILFFAIHLFQNITRALLHLRNKTQQICFEIPHDHLLHFLQLINV